MVFLIIGFSAAYLLTLLLLRKKLIAGRSAHVMCQELTSDLARSERERKIVIKGFLEACSELDRLHSEKRTSWGIPDEL